MCLCLIFVEIMLYLKLILYYQTVVSNISKKILEVSFFNFK